MDREKDDFMVAIVPDAQDELGTGREPMSGFGGFILVLGLDEKEFRVRRKLIDGTGVAHWCVNVK